MNDKSNMDLNQVRSIRITHEKTGLFGMGAERRQTLTITRSQSKTDAFNDVSIQTIDTAIKENGHMFLRVDQSWRNKRQTRFVNLNGVLSAVHHCGLASLSLKESLNKHRNPQTLMPFFVDLAVLRQGLIDAGYSFEETPLETDKISFKILTQSHNVLA